MVSLLCVNENFKNMEEKRPIIWLVNPYCMPPKYESRIQTLKRAEYLEKNGYRVVIISSNRLHNHNETIALNSKRFKEVVYNGLSFVHIATTAYDAGFAKRVLSLLIFYYRLILFWFSLPKPAVVVFTALVPFDFIAISFAKIRGSRVIVDVVDLWPESFVAYGMMKRKTVLAYSLYCIEALTYNLADVIIHTMPGFLEYVKDRNSMTGLVKISKNKKIVHIGNGVDLEDFDTNACRYQLNDSDLLDESQRKAVYVGSIRKANGLKSLINAFQHHQLASYKLLIYGDGEERKSLESFVRQEGLSNIIFKDKWLELKYIPFILTKSDLNILNYKNSEVLKYGGSQSKSYQYFAAGKPIIGNVNMFLNPIVNMDLGICREFLSSAEYADALVELLQLDTYQLKQIRFRARHLAHQYDYERLTLKFIKECLPG